MTRSVKRTVSIALTVLMIATCSFTVFARGANNASVGSLGTAYLNVKTSSVAAWTEASSSGSSASDFVQIASSAGGLKNTGANYTNAEVYGAGATSGWAQGTIRRGSVEESSVVFTATA